MISSEYTIPVQIASTADVNNVLYSNNYYESLDSCQNGDYAKSELMHTNLEECSLAPLLTNNMQSDNLIHYPSLQEQNYNLAFNMSPILHTNTMPPPLHSTLTYRNVHPNSTIKKYNRSEWNINYISNHSMGHQGYESDESNASHCSNNDGAKNKVMRNGYRFPYNQVTLYHRNSNQQFNNQDLRNFPPYSQHRNLNSLNKTRYSNNTNKRPRRNYKHCSDFINRRVHGLIERFKSKAKWFQISPILPTFGKTEISQLDQSIWNLFQAKVQTEETYFCKVELWRKLYIHIGKLYDRYGLFMVGSTMSGLGTETSDVDMCLVLRSYSSDSRSEAVRCLENICGSFRTCDFVESPEVIHAKVPILKFKGSENRFEVDLNCNNAVGIRNTRLLNWYTQLDWRVRPLVIVVKLWAQSNSINEAKNMTISSYSLALMVIHFLQCGVVPPVLPCLHELYPEKFVEKEIHELEIQEELPKYHSDNKQTLGELLLGFLQYYSCFPFETDAISVRLASRISIDECRFARSQKNDPHQWKYLCIEEPFDFTNTARSVYDLQTFKRIQQVFFSSSTILKQTNSLNSIVRNIEQNQR